MLGILAILGSFIPLLNFFSIILAIIGLVLGAVALAKISKGTAGGKGITIAGTVLSVLSIVISLVSCMAFSKAVDEVVKDSRATNVAQSQDNGADSSDKKTESGKNKYDISIAKTEVITDYKGDSALAVTYKWKNLDEKPKNFTFTFNSKAFQNGVELDTAMAAHDSGYSGTASDQLKDLQPGAELQVSLVYKLVDKSEVSLQVKPAFSFSDDLLIDEKVMPN